MKLTTIAHLHTPQFDVAVEVDDMANVEVSTTVHYKGYAVSKYAGSGLILGEARNAHTVAMLAYNTMMDALISATRGERASAYNTAAVMLRYELERAIIANAIATLNEGGNRELFCNGDIGVFYAYTLQ